MSRTLTSSELGQVIEALRTALPLLEDMARDMHDQDEGELGGRIDGAVETFKRIFYDAGVEFRDEDNGSEPT